MRQPRGWNAKRVVRHRTGNKWRAQRCARWRWRATLCRQQASLGEKRPGGRRNGWPVSGQVRRLEGRGIEQKPIRRWEQIEGGGLRSKRRKGLVVGVVDLLQRLHRAVTTMVGWVAGDGLRRRGRFGRRRRSAAAVGIAGDIDGRNRDGLLRHFDRNGRIPMAAQGAAAQQRRPNSRERRNKHPKWLTRYRHINRPARPYGDPSIHYTQLSRRPGYSQIEEASPSSTRLPASSFWEYPGLRLSGV